MENQNANKNEEGHSLALLLMQEMRRQNKRLIILSVIMFAMCLILLGYIMYDRWLDSQVETEYTLQTENYINQDNMTNSNGGGHNIVNSNK